MPAGLLLRGPPRKAEPATADSKGHPWERTARLGSQTLDLVSVRTAIQTETHKIQL